MGRRLQSYLVLALNAKGRALLQKRGTLRVRFTVSAADGTTAKQDWFVLKR